MERRGHEKDNRSLLTLLLGKVQSRTLWLTQEMITVSISGNNKITNDLLLDHLHVAFHLTTCTQHYYELLDVGHRVANVRFADDQNWNVFGDPSSATRYWREHQGRSIGYPGRVPY